MKKKTTLLIGICIVIVAIPITVVALLHQQIFTPHASGPTSGIPIAPPMGADPWLTYHDNLKILNEKYFMQMADYMHTQKFPIWDGTQKTMQEVGYTYVTIDDAWQAKRQGSSALPPNPNFANIGNPDPSLGLIAHVHSLGLKMGLYSDMGTAVCVPQTNGPQSGSYGYEMTDGAELQQWGVDYLKLDYCKVPTYSISWFRNDLATWRKAVGPNILLYMNTAGSFAPWTWAVADNSVNTWRVNQPAQDAWSGKIGSVMDTLDGSGSYLQQSSGAPYHWSDANYMAVGMSLTLDESKSQLSMWAMVTSQLIVGADILKMHIGDVASQVLFNTEVIAIDQDPLVVQATKKLTLGGVEVWEKPLAGNQFALAFLNTNNSAGAATVTWSQLGLPSNLTLRDLWLHKSVGTFASSYTTSSIPAHGIAIFRVTSPASTTIVTTPSPTLVVVSQATPLPTRALPTPTPFPTAIPTATPLPTSQPTTAPTPTSIPTDTPIPTPTDVPTDTPQPKANGPMYQTAVPTDIVAVITSLPTAAPTTEILPTATPVASTPTPTPSQEFIASASRIAFGGFLFIFLFAAILFLIIPTTRRKFLLLVMRASFYDKNPLQKMQTKDASSLVSVDKVYDVKLIKKKKGTSPTWVLLTDEGGSIEGYFDGELQKNGFAKVKGILHSDNAVPYVTISTIEPVA